MNPSYKELNWNVTYNKGIKLNIAKNDSVYILNSKALVKSPDRTGPEVYRKYPEVVNYQHTTTLTHGADSYTKKTYARSAKLVSESAHL